MAQRLEPGLRQQLQDALEKIDQGLKDASAGRKLIGVLLNDQDNSSQVKGSPMMDAYHEMVTTDAESDLKKDPAIGISDPTANEENHSMLYISGCCGPKTPIVHPDNSRLLLWIILGMFLILYEVFMTPYRLCFNAPAKGVLFVFETFIAIYFISDVCLNFFVSFYDDEQQVIKSHKTIIKTYLKGWFCIDAIASVPIDWIEIYMAHASGETKSEDDGPSPAKMMRLLRALRFLRMARVLRIAKLQALMDKFEQEIEGSAMKMLTFTVIKILVLLNAIAHMAGCFWYFIASSSTDHYGVSWLTEKMPEYKVDEGLEQTTLYAWSYHFAMATMTTVGYGDISPTNTAELAYTVALLWTSLVVFSACIGILMNLISRNYEEGQDRRRRLMDLAKYMNWRVLPRKMRGSMRKYLCFVWEQTEKIGDMEGDIMNLLSPSLRSKLCVHIFGKVLYNCAFLSWMTPDLEAMKKLCGCVKSTFFEVGDILFSYGEKNETVYILVNGWVTMCIGALFEENKDLSNELSALADNAAIGPARRADGVIDAQQLALARKNKDRANSIQQVQDQARKSFSVPLEDVLSLRPPTNDKREFAYVNAPAFFGESLLFSAEPEPVQYSAKCMTRAEFTTLLKGDIEMVVSELPYLKGNYDKFVESIKERSSERRKSQQGESVKVAVAADLEVTSDFSRNVSPDAPTKHPVRPSPSSPPGDALALADSDEANGDLGRSRGKRKSSSSAKRKSGSGSNPESPASGAPRGSLSLHPNAIGTPDSADANVNQPRQSP